ncbi:hypothetical protein KAFR_0F00350 [Kazachstania africana CBS 2517]|uniref:Mitochondrial import inner membrane translocase subunit TIM22 n=1 Tax=Kazachstania africana (strain ATCC 22294 / BCRC 22015 / CBS 2517 / CECT 1963 / NBRC 1671 / NRRL Y-8276) TaxID=1071382 RepID=H2AW82_KAZAF|nr:hypothetical protein KAFR_0F00350 [Kazachstania africana CBS 2517]CCF58632.1 hypothetical protein KAFR_0F00350 [Kazachstania africana CBS 2517]
MVYQGFGLDLVRPPAGTNVAFSQLSPEDQAERGAQAMMNFMTSCPGKAALSGVTGFALGGVFGLFMSSMAYDSPIHLPQAGVNPMDKIAELPFKQQMKLQFSDMGKKSYSSAKNFGYLGLIYAGVECVVESTRAKNDIYNGITAGCITGGGLAYNGGPQAALFGCAGFALFSAAIDLYLRSEDGRPPPNDFKE